MALIGAHSDGFFAAHWEWTVLDAHADAGAKLTLEGSPGTRVGRSKREK